MNLIFCLFKQIVRKKQKIYSGFGKSQTQRKKYAN